jgi:hypothetical protein
VPRNTGSDDPSANDDYVCCLHECYLVFILFQLAL